jgi:hypothetical protein
VGAGGVPSYVVQDLNTTPRTSGTLILTTHALYWRPSALRQVFTKVGCAIAACSSCMPQCRLLSVLVIVSGVYANQC